MTTPSYPPWLDRAAYPFTPRRFVVDGAPMQYVDEGQGRPVVFVHGTATWSFLYRDLIRQLAPHYRCIAPDHLGLGLSAKTAPVSYHPADHARRLHALIAQLGLRDITLVVHDFGGPIGLAYALAQPHNVHSLVVLNTWLWSLRGLPTAEAAGVLAWGGLGVLLFQYLDFELQVLFRQVWGDPRRLTPALHRQYRSPYARPRDRRALQEMARHLRAAGAWYDELWQQRARIRDVPALLAWGLQDPIFTVQALARWQGVFAAAHTVTFPDVGHFVPEEAPHLPHEVAAFLATH